MPSDNQWEKARELIRTFKVRLTAASPSKPFFLFELRKEFPVNHNHKGWSCGWSISESEYELKQKHYLDKGWKHPRRETHTLQTPGKECYHILACRMLLNVLEVLDDIEPGNIVPGYGTLHSSINEYKELKVYYLKQAYKTST